MKQLFTDFSGGINVNSTKLNLGFETKKVYAQTATNVEIMSNYGIRRMKGNTLLFSLNTTNDDTFNYSINSLFSIDNYVLISTDDGKLYSYNFVNSSLNLLKDSLKTNSKCNFVKYLNGVFITNGQNNPMYYKTSDNSVEVLELTGADNQTIIGEAVASFRSRLFVAQGSKLYFSALGNYNDFSTANDAGYISDFHVDSAIIVALKPYQEYLAIYKEEQTNQLWCFVPTQNNDYINNVFVYDYTNNAWVKREIPQNITSACLYNNSILTGDSLGNVYLEDNGNTFNGEPINFLYQTSFFALGTNSERKTIEEFYLIMDEDVDNKFIFSCNKDYDDLFESDMEEVSILSLFSLVWDDDNAHFAIVVIPLSYDYHDCWSIMFDP